MADYTQAEGLIIEIESDASGAVSQLDQLAEHLKQLRSTVGGKGWTTFAKNLDAIATPLQKMRSIDSASIGALAQLAQSISTLNGVKLTGTTIPKRIKEIGEAVAMIPEGQAYKMVAIAESLSKLSMLNGISISSTIPKRLEEISLLADRIKTADFTKLQELVNTLVPLAQLSAVDSTALKELSTSLNTFSKASSTSAKRGKTFNTVLANMRVKTMAVYMGLAKIAQGITENLTTYGDYIETLNLFSVSMGEAGESAYQYAIKVQDALGIDLTQWMKSQGVFQTLAKGFGIASDRATVMSQQLTQLAYDISSFYNISVEDAIQKVQSAFSGELEPVRRLGYDLSQARLQAIALSLGIEENVSAMTQAEKASLRYYAMLTQVTDAQGDLARTLESPTNQIRIFQAQLNQLSRSLGMLFIPVLNKVLPYLNAIVQVLKWIIDEIAALFGYTLPGIDTKGLSSGVTEGMEDLESQIGDTNGAAEELKNTLASFDEINLIGSKNGSGNGKGDSLNIGAGFDFDLPTYDFLGEATENRAKKIADQIKKHIAPAVEMIKDAIIFIRDNWDDIYDTLKAMVLIIGGLKLLTKLHNLKNTLSEINKAALGFSLTVAGITLSYTGGKSLAKGNILKGSIEMILGAAVAGIGGYMMFGPAGIIIGTTVSVVASLVGFAFENDALIKEQADAIFYAYDTSKLAMDEFVGSFKNFASTLTGNWEGVVEAYEQLSQGKLDFKNNIENMDALIQAFRDGKISAEEFAKGMETVFEGLGNSLTSYLQGAQNVIETELSGALGAYLTEAGFTVSEFQSMIEVAKGNYMKALETEENYIKSLETAYARGYISIDEYKTGLAQAQDKIQQITASAARGEDDIVDFNEALSKGVNLENLDETIQGITDLQDTYTEALGKIEDRRTKLVESMRIMRDDPLADEASKARWQSAIDNTNEYFKEQKKILTDGYADALDIISAQVSDSWIDVYDDMGADAALAELTKDVSTIGDALTEAYNKAGIKEVRQETLNDLLQLKDDLNEALYLGDDNAFVQWIAEFQRVKGYIDNPSLRNSLKVVFDKYVEGAAGATESTKALNHDLDEVQSDIKKVFDNMINREDGEKQIAEFIMGLEMQYPKFRNEIGNFAKLIEESMDIDLTDELEDIRNSFTNYSADFSDTGLGIAKNILGGYEDGIDLTSFDEDTLKILETIQTSLGSGDDSIISIASNWVTLISGELNDTDKKVATATGYLGDSVVTTLEGEKGDITRVAEEWVGEIGGFLKNDTSASKDAEDWVANIKKSMEGKSVDLKATGDAIRTTILTAANAVGATSFASFGGDVIGTITKGINNNKSSLATPASDIIKTMYDELKNDLDVIDKYGAEFTDSLIGSMTTSEEKAKYENAAVDMIGYIGDGFEGNTTTLEGYGKGIVGNIVSGLKTSSSSSDLTNAVTTIKNNIEKPFETMSNDIGNTFEGMLRKLAKLFNEFKITGTFNASVPNLANFKIPGFATGGYPESGEIFVANENGVPEYIGSMGNKTAVANNQQIVDGVAQGVYKAIKNTGIANDVKILTKKDNTLVFAPSVEAGKVMSQSTNMYRGTGGRY